MEGQIYHIGWDSNYIIAKRHPDCDKSKTDYFIIKFKGSEPFRLSECLSRSYLLTVLINLAVSELWQTRPSVAAEGGSQFTRF